MHSSSRVYSPSKHCLPSMLSLKGVIDAIEDSKVNEHADPGTILMISEVRSKRLSVLSET